jgi:hypothetical protein
MINFNFTKTKCQFMLGIFSGLMLFSIHLVCAQQEIFARDQVFEANADAEPLNLPIRTGIASPFERPKNSIAADLSLTSFFLNNNEFIFSNGKSIIIFNLDDKKLLELRPVIQDFCVPRGLFMGPYDDLYITIGKLNNSPDDHKFKTVRYFKNNTGYVLDDRFNLGITDWPMRIVSVGSDSVIYIDNYDRIISPEKLYAVVDYNGNLKYKSTALARISNIEITLKRASANSAGMVIGTDINTKSTVFHLNLDSKEGRYLGNISAYQIALMNFNYENIILDNKKELKSFKPIIEIYNIENGALEKISTSECALDNYAYFNVSCVYANAKGNIYALVVYYNQPGEITGDEKIVLYRWQKK